jgi:hypothetical protein
MSTEQPAQPTLPTATPPPEPVPAGRGRSLRRALIGGAVVIVVAVISVFASGALGRRDVPLVPQSVTVTYEIETSDPNGAIANITYSTPSGIAQQEDIDVPLTRKSDGGRGIQFTVPAGTFMQISAQLSTANANTGPTDISCRIRSGDAVVAENTSTGQFAIASCQGHA